MIWYFLFILGILFIDNILEIKYVNMQLKIEL